MSSDAIAAPSRLMLGIDVGSTTVKVVAVDPQSRRILWSDYQRHETQQVEKTLELLTSVCRTFPAIPIDRMRVFLTGSGARPLSEPLGGLFVQEVNAVTLAVEMLHPDAGSVIELGGQDAKIIIFRRNPVTGLTQPVCSMNDKCASGTGATIDKCLIKVGLSPEQLGGLAFNPGKLHKVAAKCGVFAETDIVNLVKSGIPAEEIMCSLADAIVQQNLSVLARGNTLLANVLLLGGPNHYLPFLRDCWRLRIPEVWHQRGYHPAAELDPDQWIRVPANAQFYAAYGAVLYGLEEPPHVGQCRGLQGLQDLLHRDDSSRSMARSGPALVQHAEELREFRRQFTIPGFQPFIPAPGETVRATIGIDGGSTSSKLVLVAEDGRVLAKVYKLSQGNPVQDMQDLLRDLKTRLAAQHVTVEIAGFGVTGYAADVLAKALSADVKIVETIAHMISAVSLFGDVDVICDIGGQDIKVLFMQNGAIRDFRLSNQCSAGNGMLLQAMADQFGVPITEYAEVAFRAQQAPVFSYGCAVFLDSDRVNFQKEGFRREELLAGLAMVLPRNVWQYVVQIPRLAELGRKFVLQGGTQYNLAAVKAQVDYIRDRVPNAEVLVHPHCGEAGAHGAAIEAWRVVRRRGESTFIGLTQALNLHYTTRNDESTRCHFCPNLCARTFVDTETPDGTTSRYIAGFSCEKGTVESKQAMQSLVARRQELKASFVNLLEYESRLAFRSFYLPQSLPDVGTLISSQAAGRDWLGRIRQRSVRREFRRSGPDTAARRRTIRIGIPRVLNLYSLAPLFRTYFEALGIPPGHVVFSPPTSEALFAEGARYGSVDTCFPSKLVQSHVHHLLFHAHKPPHSALNFLFFPSITNLPAFVEFSTDSTACPIVAGTPNVIKAAFTREVSFFERQGIDYVDGAVTPDEPFYFKRQMFEMWGDRLQVTEDESDFAVDEGWEALRRFDEDMQRRGLEILDRVEAENRIAILVLGRPYHADPGLNHGLLDEFQALGYPVLTIRSIPRDRAWQMRWFGDDVDSGRISSPFDVRDVWPENYSTNSVQKVWAAKFAARHPHVAVLDLSSFKCGHDAPTYGLIDSIIKPSQTPFMAMHDLDANKPAGSQKIRVLTFAWTLQRYQEMLDDRALRRSELDRRLASRRRELNAARLQQLHRSANTPGEIQEMETAWKLYLGEDEPVLGIRAADLQKPFPADPPAIRRSIPIDLESAEAAEAGTGQSLATCGSGRGQGTATTSPFSLPVLQPSCGGCCGNKTV